MWGWGNRQHWGGGCSLHIPGHGPILLTTATRTNAHLPSASTPGTRGQEKSRSQPIWSHQPHTGHQHRAGQSLPVLQEKAEGRQKMAGRQAGRQAAGQRWSRTHYLSSGHGTRPIGSPAHSPTGTCSGDRRTDGTYQQPPMGPSALPAHPSQLPHLRVFLVALAGLSQALACLPAAWRARAVSLDHVVGSIAEPSLDAISLVELIYLQGQAPAVRGRAGDSRTAPGLHPGSPKVNPCDSSTSPDEILQ